jgi:hypothetical protein
MIGRQVRLHGTIRASGDDPVLVRATLAAGEGPAEAAAEARDFELELEDGSVVQVSAEGLGPDAIHGDEVSRRAPWHELEQSPLARAFRGRGPGPHIKAKLSGLCALPGDAIDVIGEVTETAGEGGTYREAGPERIARVRALHAGIARAGTRQIESILSRQAHLSRPKKRRFQPPRTRTIVIWTIVIAILALIGKALVASPWLLLEWLGFVLLVIGIAVSMGREQNGMGAAGHGDVVPDWLATLACFGAGMLTLIDHAAAALGRSQGHVAVACAIAATGCASGLAGNVIGLRRARRWARVMLDAPVHDREGPDGAWGASTGTVCDPTPVEVSGMPAAISRVRTGDVTNVVVQQSFELESAIGTIEADPRQAIWTSWAHRAVSTVAKHDDRVIVEEIPVGATALVVGRLRRDEATLAISATGPESLFVYAPAPREEPRAALEKWAHGAKKLVILHAALLAIALAALASFLKFS